MAKWTKETYVLVAKVLAQFKDIELIAKEFADEFEKDNDRFDREIFLSACEVRR